MAHENSYIAVTLATLGIFLSAATARAEAVRVAMPSKSLTFLNYYFADKFGLFKSEGLDVSLPVGKADVQLAAVVSGEMEYIAAAGTVLRGAAAGLPVKTLMFTLDKPIFHMMVRPEIKRIQELKGKAIAVTAIAATDAVGARAMAKAAGMIPEQDLTIIAAGSTGKCLRRIAGRRGSGRFAFDPVQLQGGRARLSKPGKCGGLFAHGVGRLGHFRCAN